MTASESDDAPFETHRLWRSLVERELGARPGAVHESRPIDSLAIDRRNFLRLMAASLSLGGAGACSRAPEQTIVPYAHAPEQQLAGDPLYFATAGGHDGYALGLLVRSNLGRPSKVEGNPRHPASLGATDIFAQASILELWDPDRSQSISHRGQTGTWNEFVAALRSRIERLAGRQGTGLRILTEAVSSPTLAAQLRELLRIYPRAQWHQYQPVNRDNAMEGARIAFGEALETRYHLDQARVVLSLDCDFLGAGAVRYAHDFVTARNGASAVPDPGRLYAVECTPTLTGAYADHRFGLRHFEVEALARALARALGVPLAGGAAPAPLASAPFEACVQDLAQNAGKALVVAGDAQAPIVHALAHAINQRLGSAGRTLSYCDPVLAHSGSQTQSLRELAADIGAGVVDTLLIVGGNPAYNAPADLDFAGQMSKVGSCAHLSLYEDETSERCEWHIPQAHFLESWSDIRAYDGTVSIQQPLIAPLYGGKSAHELLAVLGSEVPDADYLAVREHWRRQRAHADFEAFWSRALHLGFIEGSQLPARTPQLQAGFLREQAPAPGKVDPAQIDLVFAPDPTIWDGRHANNGWLQELPKPLTKLTWDNAALIGPALGQRLGLQNEYEIELRHRGSVLRAGVWIVPGHPDQAVTLTLGYGRRRAGHFAQGAGYNAYLLRRSGEPWFAPGVEIHATGERRPLSVTQHHFTMEGRQPVRSATLARFRLDPSVLTGDAGKPAPSMYEPVRYDGHAWAMSIDLDACIGCSACTIACQAENNIPIVGKNEVRRGREMHWIRVDRYYEGSAEDPRTCFQPVTCMHCERAPCEVVCPVGATVHDSEGLNLQVYNRCIGTRFCSNNCPYKVRRFNFLQYSDLQTESLKAQRNPEVTVRMRGVMEKCTYCVQRITVARIESEKNDRPLRDGDVVTACQAACPTAAIAFGDLSDPDSRVNKAKASTRQYALLGELNTRPRTTYLGKLRNPNPALAQDAGTDPAAGAPS